MASGFTHVEWEGRRPRAVNEIEIKISNMAEKLNPSPTVGEFLHQQTAEEKFPAAVVTEVEVAALAMTTLPAPFMSLGFARKGRLYTA